MQSEDPDLQFWFQWSRHGIQPNKTQIATWQFTWWKQDQARVFFDEHDDLVREAQYRTTARSQVIRQYLIPRVCIRQILHYFHDLQSHFGRERCFNKLYYSCYWWGMKQDLATYINSCMCHNVKYKRPIDNALLGSLTTSTPNEVVAIDCAGPLQPTKQGFTHVIVMIDHFSKFIEVTATTQPTGAIIAECLLQQWIRRYGPPNWILSDNGPELQNWEVRDKL